MKYLLIPIIFLFTILITSCEEEVQEPKLIAMYSYAVEGPKVSFTNISGFFDEYIWDFGDGNTSNEKQPVHIYPGKGKYIATLTAKKNGYTDVFTDTVFAQNPTITIDGQFDDWDYISNEWRNPEGQGGTLKSMKSHYSDTHIFILVEGTDGMNLEPVQIFFDTDGNTGTGYLGDELFPYGCGFEVRMEGDTKGWTSMRKFTGSTPSQWAVESFDAPDGFLKASGFVTIDGSKYIEIAFSKEGLLPPIERVIHIGIRDLNWSWQAAGVLPFQTGTDLKTMIPVQTRD